MTEQGLAFWRRGLSTLGVLGALGVMAMAQAPLEFEVASIKVHPPDPSGRFQSSMRTLPNGQVEMTNVSLRTIIGRAYPNAPRLTEGTIAPTRGGGPAAWWPSGQEAGIRRRHAIIDTPVAHARGCAGAKGVPSVPK